MRGMHLHKKRKLDYLSRHSVLEFNSGVCFEFFGVLNFDLISKSCIQKFEKKENDFHITMTSLLYMLMASNSSDLT